MTVITMRTLQGFKYCLSMHEFLNILCYTNPTQSAFKFEGLKMYLSTNTMVSQKPPPQNKNFQS